MSSAWAIIEHDDEVLFIRRAFDRGRGGQWCPPGGTMWRNESAAAACVREVFEETGLRVTIERPVAVFQTAHYFLCSLNSSREQLRLRQEECIDSRWISPQDILHLGTVMDLRRMIPILELAGLHAPPVPRGLNLAVPDKTFGHDAPV